MQIADILQTYNQTIEIQYTVQDIIDSNKNITEFIFNNKLPISLTGTINQLTLEGDFFIPKPAVAKSRSAKRWIGIGIFKPTVSQGIVFYTKDMPKFNNPQLIVIPENEAKKDDAKPLQEFWKEKGDKDIARFEKLLKEYINKGNEVFYQYFDFFASKEYREGFVLEV